MLIQAAVLREANGAFTIEEVALEDPRDDEVIVEVAATGICHTDVAVQLGHVPIPMPVIVGHEGSGTVLRVGRAVRRVQPGQRVLMTIATCGNCPMCSLGHPFYCRHASELNSMGKRRDGSTAYRGKGGTIYGHFNGQSSFATHAIANERSVIPIPDDVSFERAAPLGCGIQTGAGTVMNYLRPTVASSLTVLGVGPVGLSSIMAAVAVGCSTIIAVDVHDDRLALAAELGATHTINSLNGGLREAIIDATAGGSDYVVDTSTVRPVIEEAIGALAVRGVMALIGVPPQGSRIEVDPLWLVRGRTITGVRVGDAVPEQFIPYLLDLNAQGRFPYERMITLCGGLEDINQAIRQSVQGDVIKAVLRIGGAHL